MVWIPARRSRSAVTGPTPGITVTFIGRSSSSSAPGATTVIPSGLSSSLATLARNFDDAMPTVAVSPPVTSWTRRRSCSPASVTVASSRSGRSAAARSTKASSSERGSTSGDRSRSTCMTRVLVSR